MTHPSIEPSNLPGRDLSIRALVILLAAATALGPFAIQIFVPALPLIQSDFGVSPATAALALSLSLWAIAIANLATGTLSDRLGRRPVLIGGMIVAAIGSLVAALATGIEVLIVGRVIQAAGAAAGMVVGRAVVRDKYDLETATGIIGKMTAIMVVAPMFAPLIGGLLLDFSGWRATFWASLAICVILLAALWFLLSETHTDRQDTGGGHLVRQAGALFTIPLFRAYFFQTACMATLWFSFMASGPHLMTDVLQRSSTEYGVWFIGISIIFMASSFSAGYWARKFGVNRVILMAASFGLIGSLTALAFAWGAELSPIAIFLPSAIVLIGSGTNMPTVQAAAMSIDPKRAGAASGLTSFIQMFSAGIAAQIVGTYQDGTLWPMAILMTIGSGLSVLMAVRVQVLAGRVGEEQPD